MLRWFRLSFLLLLMGTSAWSQAVAPNAAPSPLPNETPSEPSIPEGKPPAEKSASQPKHPGWVAQVLRKAGTGGRIRGLAFENDKIPVTLMPTDSVLRPLIELHGRFDRPGWSLIVGKVRILRPENRPDRGFTLYAYLNSRLSALTWTALGPHGEKETEEVILIAPNVQEYRIGSSWGEVLLSVGAAGLTFQQSGFGTFHSTTGLLSAEYRNPPWDSRFGLIASARMTLLSFSASPAAYGPQLIEAKLDGTFRITEDRRRPFQAVALLGVSYLTMLSNGAPFGFSNLIAEEFGARLSYATGVSSSVFGDTRYVPLGGLSGLSEAGYDLSLGWTTRLPNSHRLEFGVGYSEFDWSPDSETTLKAGLLSLRLGYGI